MATVGNNIGKDAHKYAHVRDAFFSSEEEKKFYNELIKSEIGQKIYDKIRHKKVDELYQIATDYINRVELGEFDEEGMKKAEAIISICLKEIVDVCKELLLEHKPLEWLEDNDKDVQL